MLNKQHILLAATLIQEIALLDTQRPVQRTMAETAREIVFRMNRDVHGLTNSQARNIVSLVMQFFHINFGLMMHMEADAIISDSLWPVHA